MSNLAHLQAGSAGFPPTPAACDSEAARVRGAPIYGAPGVTPQYRLLAAGTELFAQDEPNGDVFTVVEGWVSLHHILRRRAPPDPRIPAAGRHLRLRAADRRGRSACRGGVDRRDRHDPAAQPVRVPARGRFRLRGRDRRPAVRNDFVRPRGHGRYRAPVGDKSRGASAVPARPAHPRNQRRAGGGDRRIPADPGAAERCAGPLRRPCMPDAANSAGTRDTVSPPAQAPGPRTRRH